MKSKIVQCVVIFISFIVLIRPTAASVSLIQTGGIDVSLPDGSRVPIETYLERNSKAVSSVCDLVSVDGQSGNSNEWQKTLNDLIAVLFNALPGLAHTVAEAFEKTNFFFLNLPDGSKLFYTDDDGKLIEANKENGAVRMGHDVYILTTAWRNYWVHHPQESPYQTMLTRVLHEALLPYWREFEVRDEQGNFKEQPKSTYRLGKIVIEILRLASVYNPKEGHPSYSLVGKTAKEIGEVLTKQGMQWSRRFRGYNRPYYDLYLYADSKAQSMEAPKPGEENAAWNTLLKRAESFDSQIKKLIANGSLLGSDKNKKWGYTGDFNFDIYTTADIKQIPKVLLHQPSYFIYRWKPKNQEVIKSIDEYSFNETKWQELNDIYLKRPVICK